MSRCNRSTVSVLWLSTSGRASITVLRASRSPLKSGIRTSTSQPGTRARIAAMLAAKISAPPSGRSSRFTEVSTAWVSAISATASATRSGSSRSTSPGRPVFTSQNPQARVQVSPSSMKVAVPEAQHS